MSEETTIIEQPTIIDDTQTTTGAPVVAPTPKQEAPAVELSTSIVTTDNEQLPIVRLGNNSPLLPTAWRPVVQSPQLNILIGILPKIARYVKENRKTKTLTYDKSLNYNSQRDTANLKSGTDIFTFHHFERIARYSISTSQLLDAIILVFSRQQGERKAIFSFSFDDFFSWRRLEDRSEARKQAYKDLAILGSLEYECDGKHKREKEGLFSTANLVGDIFTIAFGGRLYEELRNERSYLYYPMKLILGVNSQQYRYAYFLAHKFAYDKGYSCITNTELKPYKVATLVESCNFPAPDSDSVKNDAMKLKRPFVSNIASLRRDEIANILFLNSKGGKVSDNAVLKMKLADFLNLKVKVIWNEYPERKEPEQTTKNQ